MIDRKLELTTARWWKWSGNGLGFERYKLPNALADGQQIRVGAEDWNRQSIAVGLVRDFYQSGRPVGWCDRLHGYPYPQLYEMGEIRKCLGLQYMILSVAPDTQTSP